MRRILKIFLFATISLAILYVYILSNNINEKISKLKKVSKIIFFNKESDDVFGIINKNEIEYFLSLFGERNSSEHIKYFVYKATFKKTFKEKNYDILPDNFEEDVLIKMFSDDDLKVKIGIGHAKGLHIIHNNKNHYVRMTYGLGRYLSEKVYMIEENLICKYCDCKAGWWAGAKQKPDCGNDDKCSWCTSSDEVSLCHCMK